MELKFSSTRVQQVPKGKLVFLLSLDLNFFSRGASRSGAFVGMVEAAFVWALFRQRFASETPQHTLSIILSGTKAGARFPNPA